MCIFVWSIFLESEWENFFSFLFLCSEYSFYFSCCNWGSYWKMNTEMPFSLYIHAISLRRLYETAWHNLSVKYDVAMLTEAKVGLSKGCFKTTYCFRESLTSGISSAIRIIHVKSTVQTKSFVQYKNIFALMRYWILTNLRVAEEVSIIVNSWNISTRL